MNSEIVKVRGLDECLSFLKALPKHAANETLTTFKDAALDLQKTMTIRTSGSALKARTGELKRSFKTRSYGSTLSEVGAETYTTSQYASIHETGGVVKAKRAFSRLQGGPYLTIPSSGNQTGAGVMRESARELFNRGAYIIRLKKAGKAKFAIFLNGSPMMWLVNKVEIKARLGFQEAAEQQIPTLLSKIKGMKLE